MPFSSKSFFSRETNNSTQAYAKAAVDTSYRVYNNVSWSMWVCASPGLNKTLWSHWETGTAKRSWLFSTQDNGTFRTIFSWDGTNFSLHISNDVIFDRSWINLVVTFTNGTQVVYVNGVSKTMNQTIGWGGGAAGLYAADVQHMIGGIVPSSPTADNSVGGAFNNYSLWNKVLTQSEVTELYNNGAPADLTTHSAYANLTNWLRMDQTDTAPTLIDSRAGAAANMTITKSGTNPFFNASNDYPTYSSDPGIANVRSGTTYVLDGSNKTGTAVIVSLANTKTGVAGDGGTGTYDGSDRWTSPIAGDLRSGTTLKSNSLTTNLTGTLVAPSLANTKIGIAGDGGTGLYDGSDRHTDPGIANVRSGTAYKNNSTSNNRTGTMVANLAADTKIGVASDGGTGTYVAAERYTDPGVGNVTLGTNYTHNAVAKVGTRAVVTNIVTNVELDAPEYEATLEAE